MNRPRLHVILAGLVSVLMLAACTHPAARRCGRSTFAVELPPDVAVTAEPTVVDAAGERREYLPAHPLHPLRTPAYPPEALRANVGDYTLYVQLTVDETGRVSEVVPSWRRVRLAHPQAEAFLAAVREAVAQWALSPGHWVYYRRNAAGEFEYVHTEAVSETFEVRFAFEASEVSP